MLLIDFFVKMLSDNQSFNPFFIYANAPLKCIVEWWLVYLQSLVHMAIISFLNISSPL